MLAIAPLLVRQTRGETMTTSFGAVNSLLPFGLFHIIVAAMFAGATQFFVIWIEQELDEMPKCNLKRLNAG